MLIIFAPKTGQPMNKGMSFCQMDMVLPYDYLNYRLSCEECN